MEPPRAVTLVIGYGSLIRGDDGVGQVVAHAVEDWNLPSVRSIAVHQLVPELAADIAAADQVLFVDASADPGQTDIVKETVAPSIQDGATTHYCTPSGLLTLCNEIYQSSPGALLIKVPVHIMDLSEGLSNVAKRGAEQALTLIRSIVSEAGGGRPCA